MAKVAESKITSNRNTVVPAPILMSLDAKIGDMLEWYLENERVYLKKKHKT